MKNLLLVGVLIALPSSMLFLTPPKLFLRAFLPNYYYSIGNPVASANAENVKANLDKNGDQHFEDINMAQSQKREKRLREALQRMIKSMLLEDTVIVP